MNNAVEMPARDPSDVWMDQFRDQHAVDQPLIHRGFEDSIKGFIVHWANAEWNEDLGQVVIV